MGTTTAALRRVGATDHPAILAALHEDGGVIVTGLLDAATCAAINREVEAAVDGAADTAQGINPLIAAFFGDAVKHVSSLTAVSPTFANDVLTHPAYLAVGDEFLLPRCASYVLNLAHLMVRGPGAEAQIQHRDRDIHPYVSHDGGEEMIASIVALVDFTKENGATGVVPGSHRWDPSRRAADDEIAYAEMQAGDAVIYLGSTIHFGGTNSSADQWRRGVHLSYVLGWLRTEENNYLGTPPSVAAALSPKAQALIGYSIHDAIAVGGGYLGMVDMRNPIDMLADGSLRS